MHEISKQLTCGLNFILIEVYTHQEIDIWSRRAPPNESKDRFCVKQVEYQCSDMSLLANESLAKHMSKDPEGYGKNSGIV